MVQVDPEDLSEQRGLYEAAMEHHTMIDGTTDMPRRRKQRRTSPLTVGIRFENEVKRRLVAAGWYAVRTAASKTPADIVALAPASALAEWKGTVLIQCKGHQRNLPRHEVAALLELADRHRTIDVAHCHPGDEPGQIVLDNLRSGERHELPATPDDGRTLSLVGDAGPGLIQENGPKL